MDDPIVILRDLPTSVRGFCFHDDEGTAFIVLNSRLPREIQLMTFQHELDHIRRGEMYDFSYNEYSAG